MHYLPWVRLMSVNDEIWGACELVYRKERTVRVPHGVILQQWPDHWIRMSNGDARKSQTKKEKYSKAKGSRLYEIKWVSTNSFQVITRVPNFQLFSPSPHRLPAELDDPPFHEKSFNHWIYIYDQYIEWCVRMMGRTALLVRKKTFFTISPVHPVNQFSAS